jgi:hypothetical protein
MSDGKPCYFGTFINNVSVLPTCLDIRGNTLYWGLVEQRFPIDPDSFERIIIQFL